MKFLFDLFPVILFFVVFRWSEAHASAAQAFLHSQLGTLIAGGVISEAQAPIMLATLVAVLATFAQIAYLLVRRKKIDGMLWVSFAIITVFGGLTIYFHDDTFIKWKPTLLYWSYALALLGSQLIKGKNLTRLWMGKLEEEMDIPDHIWSRLNRVWMAFALAMGALNLYVAFNFSNDAWVNFKLFGATGLMFIFVLVQVFYLSRFGKPVNESHKT